MVLKELKKIWAFGIPYLKPYRFRFILGIALSMFFGLSNGLFVLSVNALFNRLAPPAAATVTQPKPASASPAEISPEKDSLVKTLQKDLKKNARLIGDFFKTMSDQWLPRMGQPVTWQQMLGGFFLLPLVMGGRAMASYFSTYCLTWVSARVIRDMQVAALKKAQELSMAFFQRMPVSDIYARITADTNAIYTAMTNGFIDTIREPFTVLSILISMLIIDWKLTLIASCMLPLVLVPVVSSGKRLRMLTKKFTGLSVTQSGSLLEALAAIRIVKAYAMEALQLKSFREQANLGVEMSVKTAQTRNLLNPLIEILSMLGVGFLLVFVFTTNAKPGNLVAFLTALLLAPLSIKRIANLHLTLQMTSVSTQRLEELFSEKPSVVEPARPRTLTKFNQGIRIEGVTFSYGHTDVLHQVSFEIPKGKKILINLLMRFYDPTKGRILLDGHDLREYATKDLLAQMALVSQDVVLFNLPVATNIGFGHEGATQAEIEQAAKRANAHEFIMKMPQGYESPCGEHGQLLSGGQKARVAIARAFVRNAPILVLDEPTAALDSKAESEIQKAIDSLEEGRTVICIAHRLSTLANMDEIVVLDHGRIVEHGTFEELLRAKGHFAKMAEQQRLTAKD
ncbi:MAG: ABC transporter ATP-binding protein [Verrucomicrobia bacterium]|nr:ABC transporter ATP-binding protein [Verrucomicrobiota bacterium]